MNKIKHVYIILLSILFMNNIISMENQDYIASEQETQLLSLPAELMTAIINETVIQQVKETINEWNDIFQQPKKINLQDTALASQQFKDVLNVALKSPSLKNYINDLKSKHFDELFEDLKHQSIEEYRDLSTEDLNKNLFNILNKETISKEDFKVAVKLILAGADVDTKNNEDNTALMLASIYGYKEIVEILIKAGADVNTKNYYGYTALIESSSNGHKEIVEMLIKAGTNVDAKNNDGYTALMWASKNGYKEIVELLIKAGADVDAKSKYCGYTALMLASEKGHKEIVEILLQAGTNVDTKNNEDDTALIFASIYGYKEIVEILIKAGTNIEAKNNDGYTALMWASKEGHKDIVEILQSLEN
ncbi:ankyrin repeat domain-containing protein [Candidatus Babela massiliensis]|uniref:Ankyrin repeats containing protein n=1 Tax=Candidatus Babela massiliensis TaxID=673862 RepID=V6DF86_9BACT|nr:ankyrin repeat domain-containing protein [Candidatus Babela massiliensis]CDK30214.1 Ankyrin repeats containing protein [Candidatus Babela massiliensis]